MGVTGEESGSSGNGGPSSEWLIASKELLPILFAVAIWGKNWRPAGELPVRQHGSRGSDQRRSGQRQKPDAFIAVPVLLDSALWYSSKSVPFTRGVQCGSGCSLT